MIRVIVLGKPAPKGNARAFVNKKTGRAILSSFGSGGTEKRLRSWDAAVRESARDAIVELRRSLGYADIDKPESPPFVGLPLSVGIVFQLTRPAGHYGSGKNAGKLKPQHVDSTPTGKPDVDKLARSTIDPLHGIVFDDDSRIVELMVRKVWAKPGHEGAIVMVDTWRAPA